MNSATKIIVTSLGVLIGVSSIINHGFFEILQGNKAAGFFIQSVGEGNFMGAPAGEEAITIIPNFLYSGIATILLSLFIIIWSFNYIHRKYGSTIFLFLCILLSLAGGGTAQIVIVLLVWAASMRIRRPFALGQKIMLSNFRRIFGTFWLQFLVSGMILILTATQIALYKTFPWVTDEQKTIYISLIMLITGVGIIVLAIISGLAYDLENEELFSSENKTAQGVSR